MSTASPYLDLPARPSRRAALRHAVSVRAWRDALSMDTSRIGYAAPLRVGMAVGVVLVIGGLTGHRDIAGLAALGTLISAFCRPDPYPVRAGRLGVLAVAITTAVGIGAALGAFSAPLLVEIGVISALAGAAAYLVSALHIVGPGGIIFVFAATGAAGFAGDLTDVGRAVAATALGSVIGMFAALAPWLIAMSTLRGRAGITGSATRESLWTQLAGGHSSHTRRHLLIWAARITVAAAAAAGGAAAAGLAHPMWAAMGAMAAMQGVSYHHTVSRGVARLLGNIGGAAIAAVLLALPLGYWGAVAAIVVLQTCAEVFSTVNYAICSLAVTPMALLLTGLGAGLSPEMAVDRVLDTGIGIVVGIVVAALAITSRDLHTTGN
ncbi:FUSC family protein [Gordonia sp. L191]|uniref:FUSC family protein n=1 Tax=Gordonia sp. L191 TaxID=2982699 RepID=UPI0024C0982E|nr:FUSC family protein [Gordonia sp. L191]WHU48085.1 FUSC family protein [Gordonia sp. L191]